MQHALLPLAKTGSSYGQKDPLEHGELLSGNKKDGGLAVVGLGCSQKG